MISMALSSKMREQWKLPNVLLLSRFSRVRLCARPHRRQPTRLPRPWDSPGKNTGVGCHFLLQYRKMKSESEVAQSCLTLRPHGLQPTRLLHPWNFQARVLEWGAIAFSIPDVQCVRKEMDTFPFKIEWSVHPYCHLSYWNKITCNLLFKKNIYYIWLCQVLVAALGMFRLWYGMWESLVAKCGIFSCGMWTLSWGKWDLVPWWGIEPRPLAMGVWSLSHWATREIPTHGFLNIRNLLLKLRCSVQQMLAFSSFSITLNISMIHQLPHHQFPYMQPKQLLCM